MKEKGVAILVSLLTVLAITTIVTNQNSAGAITSILTLMGDAVKALLGHNI